MMRGIKNKLVYVMAQVSSHKTEAPFGEVSAWHNEDGSVSVKAAMQMKPSVEHARAELAINGANSMAALFGGDTRLSAFFLGLAKPNLIQPAVRKISESLSPFDSDGQVRVIHYACAPAASQIQEVGQLVAQSISKTEFALPKRLGRGTQVYPAMRYLSEDYADVPWIICLFISDGLLDDLEQAEALSKLDERGGDAAYGVEDRERTDHKTKAGMKNRDEILPDVMSYGTFSCTDATWPSARAKTRCRKTVNRMATVCLPSRASTYRRVASASRCACPTLLKLPIT